jgi:hypothetical protein
MSTEDIEVLTFAELGWRHNQLLKRANELEQQVAALEEKLSKYCQKHGGHCYVCQGIADNHAAEAYKQRFGSDCDCDDPLHKGPCG